MEYTDTTSTIDMEAFNKVMKVIHSCQTHSQLLTTEMWIDKIKDKFDLFDRNEFIDTIYIKHGRLLK